MFLLPRHKEILEIARMQGKVLVEDLEDVVADLTELALDLLTVLLDLGDLARVALGLFFLLDGADDAP